MGLTKEWNPCHVGRMRELSPLGQPDNSVLCASLISWPGTAWLVEYPLAIDFAYEPK